MQVTTVMVVVFFIWGALTLMRRGPAQIPPAPVPSNLLLGEHALGWLRDTRWIQFSAVAIVVAFGHSLLAMSGFETLAQVYREIAATELHDLHVTGHLVF